MKAAVLHASQDIRYEEYKTPQVKPGTVKVRIRATGICGSDLPRVLHDGAHFYPIVLGHEFAGDIIEVGEGVNSVKINDTVAGAPLLACHMCIDCKNGNHALCKRYSFIGSREQGSFAEYVVIPELNAVKYDSVIPYEQAAMFEPATVAIHGLLHTGYQGGGDVAVLGSGTIGIFTMQWAKIFGAKSVTVIDIDEKRLQLATRLGADIVINAKKHTPSGAYDYVFETAGSTITMKQSFELAKNKAKVCFIGTPHENLTFTPREWENINRKEFTLTGSWMSYSAPFPGKEWELTAHYFATGQLAFDAELIYCKLPLSQVANAFEMYKDPNTVKGKIILIP